MRDFVETEKRKWKTLYIIGGVIILQIIITLITVLVKN